ncbi:2-oxoglutarate dehydrogenase, E2 component, dihydrolipoamide succinyltransferase [Trueperella pecoris]|uniref:Dihydrolipoamide acetyltransferase component of pyruvate dehydrogenase complex n=1 Tax=Trueperella pecoris TaxID=2733571 RepID=A0A7M1R2I1_9ACTO|nr:2-oxoglutarate dehydrogenase, E2 component, dihydrolipoamide succinyltransferase [Trueperella pecoris]QOR48500.1 2-oxoglutarate dehydrogenase, E2 component, dihydrolipoamide succinyltransferase [Trueperella pecoris]
MSEPIKMPALGESVDEGTVTTWLKNVGDTVEADEPILEVSTDKVDTEVPAPASGVLESIEVGEDETVSVGTVLGYIGDGSGAAAAEEPVAEAPVAEEPATEAPVAEEPKEEPKAEAPKSGGSTGGVEVKMPALGESVDEGTVTTWLKQVGDEVEEDEPIVEVSTDKVDTEVPAPASGVLTEIKVSEDETVGVGTVLAIIGGEMPAEAPAEEPKAEEPKAEAPEEEPKAEAPKEEPKAAPAAPAPAAAPADGKSAYVTPIVRKLAKELGVDLDSVSGTGVGGRIRRQDVEVAAEAAKAAVATPAPAAAPAPAAPAAAPAGNVKSQIAEKAKEAASLRGTRQKMTGVRKAIAKHMVESLQVSAQLTTVMEVDVTRIVNLRARAKESFRAREGVNLTYLPFFVQAATEALKAHPIINSSVEGNEIVYHDAEHVGIAVDTERGLFVPVIKNAGDLNISGIAKQIADLAARTRDGKIKGDELSGSTFTITNTGSAGAIFDTPIINQPNVAIMGTGAIFKAPGVVKDQDGNEVISIRSKCFLSISYDHRIIDGAAASRYLRDVKFRLEEGDFGNEVL